MRQCRFRGSDEDIISFIEDLPKLIDPEWKTGLHVKVRGSSSVKNSFNLCFLHDDSSKSSMMFSLREVCSMPGEKKITVPALDHMISVKHPDFVLRPAWMTVQDLIDKCSLDKVEVYRQIFKSLKTCVSWSSRYWYNSSGKDMNHEKFWIEALRKSSKKFTGIHEMIMTASLG